ncbi:hypothetical protein XO12_10690, partial [Marinitoga sp. 1154]|uniref:AAA family ATPase n=1 Tax=Marinitoga sp. 1154 TaxID=1643335 RepID=UPI0020CA52BE
REYDISPIKNNLPTKFGHLITELSKKYKEKTVILIDEYESPILEHINNKEKAEEFRAFLREFYKKVKTKDEYIKKENNKCNTV